MIVPRNVVGRNMRQVRVKHMGKRRNDDVSKETETVVLIQKEMKCYRKPRKKD